ncbi:MAG: GlxA family transcriptional regulator [Pseudomonadota bacterium]
MQKTDTPVRIGIWPVPGYAMMSCASVLEPLRAANLGGPAPLFDLAVFGAADGAVSSSGAILPTQHRLGSVPPLDMFLVIAGGDPFAFDDAQAFEWLRTMAHHVPLIGGVSAGPVLLARAGLLSGRICTVHWEHAAELSTQYPDITVKRRLFVMERDRVTCGGGTAPMDLMHALIARAHGKAVARRVSDWFLHTDVRSASAPQRAAYADQAGSAPRAVQEAIALMEDHLSDPLSLPQLGLICGVSARQLNRLFSEVFGTSTMAFYRKIRLEAGRHLIRTSDLTLVEIADATGFHSAGHFSHQFAKAYETRPSALR